MGALMLALPAGATAQGDHPPALSRMPVADVSCRMPTVNAKGKPLPTTKKGERSIQLLGKYPPREVNVVLDAANHVLEFHSLVSWSGPSFGNETIDVRYKPNGQVKSGSRTLKPDRARPAATTPLLGDDYEEIAQMTHDVLTRCGS
jgi:hypothetical protein